MAVSLEVWIGLNDDGRTLHVARRRDLMAVAIRVVVMLAAE